MVPWLEAAAIVAGIGLVAFHGFGFGAEPFDRSSPSATIYFYAWTGIKAIGAAAFITMALAMPVAWICYVVGGIRKVYRWLRRWLGEVGEKGLAPSVAVALPWIAAGTIGIGTVVSTGGVSSIGFWFTVLFYLGLTTFMTGFIAPLLVGVVQVVLYPVAALAERLVPAVLAKVSETVNTAACSAVVLGAGVAIYANLGIDFPDTPALRLPLANPAWSSLLVVAMATSLGAALSIPIRRFRRKHHPGYQKSSPVTTSGSSPGILVHASHAPVLRLPKSPTRPWRVDEPDEEFWSPTPVVAWRNWRWTGATLRGMCVEWPSETLTAICESCSDAPGWDHTCGIYALKKREDLANLPWVENVFGRVELSGLVIEHEQGYRARSARILELWVTGSSDEVRRLGAHYPRVTIHHQGLD